MRRRCRSPAAAARSSGSASRPAAPATPGGPAVRAALRAGPPPGQQRPVGGRRPRASGGAGSTGLGLTGGPSAAPRAVLSPQRGERGSRAHRARVPRVTCAALRPRPRRLPHLRPLAPPPEGAAGAALGSDPSGLGNLRAGAGPGRAPAGGSSPETAGLRHRLGRTARTPPPACRRPPRPRSSAGRGTPRVPHTGLAAASAVPAGLPAPRVPAAAKPGTCPTAERVDRAVQTLFPAQCHFLPGGIGAALPTLTQPAPRGAHTHT